MMKPVEVPAKPSGLPEIDFTGIPTEGEYPLTVQFLDNTTTTWVDSWQWNFGDGGGSIISSPNHTFTQPGHYSVSLSIGKAGYSAGTVKCRDRTDNSFG